MEVTYTWFATNWHAAKNKNTPTEYPTEFGSNAGLSNPSSMNPYRIKTDRKLCSAIQYNLHLTHQGLNYIIESEIYLPEKYIGLWPQRGKLHRTIRFWHWKPFRICCCWTDSGSFWRSDAGFCWINSGSSRRSGAGGCWINSGSSGRPIGGKVAGVGCYW